MTHDDVQTIHEAVAGNKAMADLLDITERAVRQFCQNGAR